jgi:hypothetical protein
MGGENDEKNSLRASVSDDLFTIDRLRPRTYSFRTVWFVHFVRDTSQKHRDIASFVQNLEQRKQFRLVDLRR